VEPDWPVAFRQKRGIERYAGPLELAQIEILESRAEPGLQVKAKKPRVEQIIVVVQTEHTEEIAPALIQRGFRSADGHSGSHGTSQAPFLAANTAATDHEQNSCRDPGNAGPAGLYWPSP
jgi:hypothetical protein